MWGYIAVGIGGILIGVFLGVAIMCMLIVGDYKDPYQRESEWDENEKDGGSEK